MPELVIEAGRTERQYWRDLWHYRELFYFLAWRDILIRYKQTVVGSAWALIRPLLTMLVLSVVFGRLAGLPAAGVPYPLLVLCGVLPWQFFSTAVSECGNSLVSNAALISKVYFPRLTVPASSVITSLADLLISGCLLAAILVWYRYLPDTRILFLPAFVLMAFAAAFGLGVWISALTVRYRDFKYVVPFLVQLGLYLSPVGFSSDVVADEWRLIYSLNPMVGVIDGFRWAILAGAAPLYLPGLLVSLVVILILLGTGLQYFRRTERTFADVI
jgi:lipopolysaccharide transport system permease protein